MTRLAWLLAFVGLVGILGGPQALVTLVLFVLILGGLVLVHEVGHFWAARRVGVRVLEFGIGIPPRAKVLANRGETLYTLNWLPIGGFVRLEGEADDPALVGHVTTDRTGRLTDVRRDEGSFSAKALPAKAFILVAGVAMNFLVALLLITGITLAGDPTVGIRISQVQPDSPAQRAGLVAGDVIERVNEEAYSWPPFTSVTVLDALRARPDQTVTLSIRHADGSVSAIKATIRSAADIAAGKGALGITIAPGALVVTADGIGHSPSDALSLGWSRTVEASQLIVSGVADLFRNLITSPTTPPGAAGPVGIAVQIGDVFFTLGPVFTLYLVGLLSANLAVVNILPLPPFDGGRLAVIIVKRIAGPRLGPRAERLTLAAGLTFVFLFFVWLTAFDVLRLFGVSP